MRDRLAGPRSCLTRDSDDALVTGLARMLAHELGEIAALFDGYIAYLEERPPDGVVCLRRTTERLRRVYEGLLELADVASSQPSRSAVDPATVVAAARRRLRAASAGRATGSGATDSREHAEHREGDESQAQLAP